MVGEDPEQRIAELERQLADARRIADLERQLAEARRAAQPPQDQAPHRPQGPTGDDPWGGYDSTGRLDTTLAAAPRRVPFVFWLAELIPFRWPYVFTIVMVGIVAFSTLTWFFPVALPFVMVAAVAAVYAYQLAGAAKRMALLKWGEVARVIGARMMSRGTYYSGVTYGNAPLPIAHGWKVMRPVYSGPSTTTEIRYSAGGQQKTLRVSGREYIDGVVLADPRKPERALCVTSFTYDLDRDATGNWIGKLRTRLVVGMVSWVVLVTLVLGTAFALAYYERDVMSWLCNNASTSGIDCSPYV